MVHVLFEDSYRKKKDRHPVAVRMLLLGVCGGNGIAIERVSGPVIQTPCGVCVLRAFLLLEEQAVMHISETCGVSNKTRHPAVKHGRCSGIKSQGSPAEHADK